VASRASSPSTVGVFAAQARSSRDDSVCIKESDLKGKMSGSNLGLFAAVDLPRGFGGVDSQLELLVSKKCQRRNPDGDCLLAYGGYLWFSSSHSDCTQAGRFGRWINRAEPSIGMPANCSGVLVKHSRCYIRTIRAIRAGEELLAPYGSTYRMP